MDTGIDYAGRSPGGAAVKATGYNFVARYLSRYTAKVITKAEYDDMGANDVGVVLVFEDYANQALQGFNQGVADAQVALAQANALGWPSDRPIHFAVDFDIIDAQKPVAGEYMKGIISVIGLGRTGAYGGFYWIKYCADNGLASFFWQAVAWSGGQVHPSTTLFQQLGGTVVNGTSCDINHALKADYGSNKGEDMVSPSEADVYSAFRQFAGKEPTGPDQVAFYMARDIRDLYHDLMFYEVLPKIEEVQQAFQTFQPDLAIDTPPFPNQSAYYIYHTKGVLYSDLATGVLKELNTVQPQLAVASAALKTALDENAALKKELGTNQGQPVDPNSIIITQKGWAAVFAALKTFFAKNN